MLVGCSIGRQDVYFDEMPTKPILKLSNSILTVKTSNSIKNSALSIYKINISVDQNKKVVYLSAHQAAGKAFKEYFTLELTDYKISEPRAYTFYWLDPDKEMTKLDIIEEK